MGKDNKQESIRIITKRCMQEDSAKGNDIMKVLVTGVKGQLGYDVMKVLKSRNIECLGADIEEFDITDAVKTREFITGYSPDVVVHCSAYTAVDRAEEKYRSMPCSKCGGTC